MTYSNIPVRVLDCLYDSATATPAQGLYCAGFEVEKWRCDILADHVIEWMADYALVEEELQVSHANMYVRLREAASRVYKSSNFKGRGEIGEIVLHAICRDHFGTIPVAPRVHYLTASNDVVKSFDMVHVRYTGGENFEIWLGEAKFYKDGADAVASAISSITAHIDAGFLKNEKLLLGPQISKNVPRYDEIRALLSQHTSLDKLFKTAVFPICIACDSEATLAHTEQSTAYISQLHTEISKLQARLDASALLTKIKVLLLYVPLGSKEALAVAFDKRLKGILQ